MHGYPPRWRRASILGTGCLLVAVGRRIPAGVEKESKGSSKGQNYNVFSGRSRRTGVRSDAGTERRDFLSVIKSQPSCKCQQLFNKQKYCRPGMALDHSSSLNWEERPSQESQN